MSQFADATAVTDRGDGTYAAHIDPSWSIGGNPNGGYLLAMLTRAAVSISGHPDPVAVSGHFLQSPEPGEAAAVRLELLKTGRTVGTVSALLTQHDRPMVQAVVTCAQLPPAGAADYRDLIEPELPPVEQCVVRPVTTPSGRPVELTERLQIRLHPDDVGWMSEQPSGQMSMRAWVRLADLTPPDPTVAMLAADVLPPSTYGVGRLGWAPTVQLSVLLRGVPAPGWLKVATRARLLAGGWFDEEAEVWDSAGRLVVQTRQLARG